jgi:superfamily II DNA or RNA helicase
METKLLKYQVPHFFQLEEILKIHDCCLDASDTGTGKTYVAIALAASLGKLPFIICPKSVIPNWISVAKALGVELFGIANYELIKGCKYYTAKLEKVDCPYMDKFNILDPKDTKNEDKKRKVVEDFRFSLPSDVMVIFDEAHRCKNHKTITSRLLLSIFKCKCKVLMLSATIADKIPCFKPFGVVFGFYDEIKKFSMWVRKIKKSKEIFYKDKGLNDRELSLDIIHSKIFPEYGSRMRIKELGSMFPSNQVLSQSYMSNNQEEIQEQYDIIKDAFEDLKNKETRSAGLGKLIRARMKIEMLKVPIMLDIIEEAIDSDYSVVVFVNYRDTMNYLAHYFETDCLIHGEQTMEDRQDSIDKFQSNKTKIIIAIIQAGGVGISLHDVHGGHPRMSVISPTWSGQDMQQVLGRIHRAGSQSPALQRIVYCAGTYEEKICELIQEKLTNISGINDGDLIGPHFDEEEFTEEIIDKVNKDLSSNVKNKVSAIELKIVKHQDKNDEKDSDDTEEAEEADETDDVTEDKGDAVDPDPEPEIRVMKKKNKDVKEKDVKVVKDGDSDDDKKEDKKNDKEKAIKEKKFKLIVDKTEKRKYVKKVAKDDP